MAEQLGASTDSYSEVEELPSADVMLPIGIAQGVLQADLNEPHTIFSALGQSQVQFTITSLNTNGHSDYLWARTDGTLKEVERKTWGEVLAGVDRVEEQMLRHLRAFPLAEHVLLLEGVVQPGPTGVHTMTPARANSVWVRGHSYKQNLAGIYAWLYQMSHYITILPTFDMNTSATALVAMFKSDQRTDHTTLRRHIVLNDFHPDPVVTILMAMLKGVGETRALAIKDKFPTIYSLVCATPSDLMRVEGIGPGMAHEIPRRLGSPYA